MRKYTKELLENAAKKSISITATLKELGIPWSGGMHSHIKRKLDKFGVDTSHFLGQAHNRGKELKKKIAPEEILIKRDKSLGRQRTKYLKRAMLHFGLVLKCSYCSLVDWNGKSITLEIDHINDINTDDRLENLRFICPNCHSQKRIRI